MTLEEFAHRCLMIKAGNATLDIPCCANCEHYIEHIESGVIIQNGKVIKEVPMKPWWSCSHPTRDVDDAELKTKPEDFCSRWESRNEPKEN